MRKYILPLLALILLFRIGYTFFDVGRGLSEATAEGPSIFYGRSTVIKKGVHLENMRLPDRLRRLSYKKVAGPPYAAGTFSEEQSRWRIFLKNSPDRNPSEDNGPVEIVLRDGRVDAIISSTGKTLTSIQLEPEEIVRIIDEKIPFRPAIGLSAISPFLQNAVIASEDARFYSHMGIDLPSVVKAFFSDPAKRNFPQSSSTITQQLARNFFLSPEKTFARKLRESELAFVLELKYTKKQVLEMYLNRIYWGQDGSRSIYGAGSAAGFYFSKSAAHLSLEEASLLAGILHSPNRYRNFKAAKERRNAVLSRMKDLKMISDGEFQRACKAPVRVKLSKAPAQTSYFIDFIQRITKDDLGSEKLYHRGYRYYTTMDPVVQAIADEALAEGIREIERRAFPAGEKLQAALVAVDPATGEMIAMVGGRSYRETQFNRAVDANRQSGSAFKPFVLLAALSLSLEQGKDITLSSTVSGKPLSINTPEGMWRPTNFENKHYDRITIRKMIEDSVNTATTRLAGEIGFREVLKAARRAGITSPLSTVPSMALGSFEVTPRELAYAYTTIASGGIRFDPFALYSVKMANGRTIISKTVRREKAFDPRIIYLAGYAMQGVLERGTAAEAKALGIYFPAAGKTGTTNGNRDSWFVGYTPDIVCAVWVGYDSGADTGLTGARGALHIWSRFIRSFYGRSAPANIVPPAGIETAIIDPQSGYLATTSCPQKFKEAYLKGTAPKKACPDHPVKPVMKRIYRML